MTAIDAIRKKHQPKKREHQPCSCGSTFFWSDVYHGQLYCAACSDPPSLAMVQQVFVTEAGDLRDITSETLGCEVDQDAIVSEHPEYVQWIERDGRIVSAVKGVGEKIGPRKNETWKEFWERLPDHSECYGARVGALPLNTFVHTADDVSPLTGSIIRQATRRRQRDAATASLFRE